MAKANSGFVANSGIQKHSAGDDFPITHYCVGSYPRPGNGAYWVVSHPSGAKRWTWSAGERDRIIAAFREADGWVGQLEPRYASERTAFEIALLGIEKRDNKNYGFDMDTRMSTRRPS